MMKFCVTGKNNKPVAGAAAGTCAIFDAGIVGTDYAPFLNPKAHLDRIAFHSALDYVGVEGMVTATVNLPAGSFGYGVVSTIELGPHGKSGKPLVISEFSVDGGSTWFTMNGMTFSQIGVVLVGTSFVVQCDNEKLYLFVTRRGTLSAQTVNFRVHILARNFGQNRPNNGKAFRATPEYVEAGGGVFDTRRKYLQTPSPGQSPDLVHVSGPTIKMALGTESGGTEVETGFGNHANNYNIPMSTGWSTSWPPYITQPPKIPLVFQQPGEIGSRLRFETGRFKLSNADGEPILDTARKLVSFVDEFKATGITVPARAAVNNDPPHHVVHYSNPVPDGADMIFGWLQLTSASIGINTYRPLDFSGTLLMTMQLWAPSAVTVRSCSMLYPRIQGGNLEIVEHYYNRIIGGASNDPLPTYTFDIHMFVCATTGGLS